MAAVLDIVSVGEGVTNSEAIMHEVTNTAIYFILLVRLGVVDWKCGFTGYG